MKYDDLLNQASKILEGRYLFSEREMLIRDLSDAVKTQAAKIDRLSKALIAFAEAAENLTPNDKDDWDISGHHAAEDICVKDLRVAAAAIREMMDD